MHANRRLAVAALLLAAGLVTGCPSKECPTTDAPVKDNQAPACTGAPTTVAIKLQLCEDCSRTSPGCVPVYDYLATQKVIQLNTTWDVCEDDKGCSFGSACSQVTCTVNLPASDVYTIEVIKPGAGGPTTDTFTLDNTAATPVCGAIGTPG